MRDLPEILSAYRAIDRRLDEEWSVAIIRADKAASARAERRQQLNDQAYFLLCFGQIEAEIDTRCRILIRACRSAPRWEDRRPWFLYNPDDRRLSGLSFEERSALLLEPETGEGWKILMRHYSTRNRLAHGQLLSTRIDVNAVVADLYVVQGALKP